MSRLIRPLCAPTFFSVLLILSSLTGTASGSLSEPTKSASAAQATANNAGLPANAFDVGPWCQRLGTTVPGLTAATCRSAGLVAGAGRSVRGVPLWSRDIAPAGQRPRLKVLLLGGIHGDELASVNLVFNWMKRCLDALPVKGGHSAAIAWRVVPLLNPDGLMHSPPTRVNAHGVDLNRNFPTANWAHDAQPYWIQRMRRDPRRFPGFSPLSEPESRWLVQQIDDYRPDLIVSVHAPYGLLDFDGPPPVPRRLGSLQLDPIGVYPGSLGNYGSLARRVPVMTLELKSATQVSPAELGAMWNDLKLWIGKRAARVAM